LHKIKPGDDAKAIAKRLTKEIYFSRSGESDFNRPLNYSRPGVA
jgi:hypothetical protein